MDEKALAVANSSIVMPAVTSDEAVKAFKAYQDLAKKNKFFDLFQYILLKISFIIVKL